MTRPRAIRLVIEGERAEAAARDLFSHGWFEAEWEQRRAAPDVPVVSASVIALAGGSVTIAERLREWWQSWGAEGAAQGPLSVALEGVAGRRVALEGASRDSLVEVLRVLHAPVR